jgi:cytochrome d ubiquinol oxidase subunit II
MDASSTLPMLATIWFLIVGLFLMFYVVLDGFDLGVGILSLFVKEEARRGMMMNSLGTVWDANETWIVIVGGTLFGAFPLAFGVVFQALYIPVMLMLFGFIFRGVAFEFRHLARREAVWEWSFGIGSLIAAGAQGLALGGLLQGPSVEQGRFVGGPFDWLTPFSLLATGGVLVGYTLLGTTYLMIRMQGTMEYRLYGLARYLAVAMLAVAAAVSLWCPFRYAWIFDRWFSLPDFYYYASLPALALFAFTMLFRSLAQRRTVAPFVWTLLIFVASFAGLGATFFPYLVPGTITVFEAAAAPNTLVFMLAIVSFFIPIMIFYNAYQYAVFSGKLEEYAGSGENQSH